MSSMYCRLWVFTLLMVTGAALAAEHVHNKIPTGLVCAPAGLCEPCPADSLQEPFCQPFGNRRLMHCVNSTIPDPQRPTHPPGHARAPPFEKPWNAPPPASPHPLHSHEGETLAWAGCGRVVAQERADFLEFVACNILFAVVAVFGVFARARRMAARQARQLAARIGLGR
ncbi:unnamed protein product [Mycena citricolor]|uniref:Uncharacterized protein n=1 Tax=Mycena citricolor TaxID=2018698 RepID=A0AAD2K0N1_9AGAR|nr:unnamed protein product [Mycena citricolor]